MSYIRAFDIAEQVLSIRERFHSERYREGVVRAAALAAVGLIGEAVIDAMERVFADHLISRWDGSIA